MCDGIRFKFFVFLPKLRWDCQTSKNLPLPPEAALLHTRAQLLKLFVVLKHPPRTRAKNRKSPSMFRSKAKQKKLEPFVQLFFECDPERCSSFHSRRQTSLYKIPNFVDCAPKVKKNSLLCNRESFLFCVFLFYLFCFAINFLTCKLRAFMQCSMCNRRMRFSPLQRGGDPPCVDIREATHIT